MSKTLVLMGVASLLASAGCATEDKEPAGSDLPDVLVAEPNAFPTAVGNATDGEPTSGELAFQFFTARATGELPPIVNGAGVFPDEQSVYLSAAGTGAVAGDYLFDIIALVTLPDSSTDLYFLAGDVDACRNFHVNAAGQIDQLYDPGCASHHGVDTVTGGFTVQVAPFEDIRDIVQRDDAGRAKYTLRIARVDQSIADGSFVSFLVEPAENPDPPCDL